MRGSLKSQLLLFSLTAIHFNISYGAESYNGLSFQEQEFIGADSVSILYKYALHPAPKGTMVVSPGVREPCLKYLEIMFELYDRNSLNVFCMDHRNQAQSGRSSHIDSTAKTYIKDYRYYFKDFENFVNQQVKPQTHGAPYYLLAHSMGGWIASSYLENFPEVFSFAAFSSPLFQIYAKYKGVEISERASKMASQVLSWLGKSTEFAPGQKEYDPHKTFEENITTHSRERYLESKRIQREYPITQMGGATNSWVVQVVNGTREVRAKAHQVVTPLVIFQAGIDLYVQPQAQEEFCSSAQNCKMKRFDGAFHEILMEKDEIRDSALEIILENFKPISPE